MKRVPPEDRDAARRAVTQQLNNAYGYKVIARAGDVPNPFLLRRPSGIMQLDIDTGGGLPAGGWCLVSGPEGAGKTHLIYKYFHLQQQLYGDSCRLALASVEFLPDHFHMRDCGVAIEVPDELILEKNIIRQQLGLPPFTKEEIKELKRKVGEIDIIRARTGEGVLDAVLGLYATGAYSMIAVDSVSVILPSADADKDLTEDAKRAASANLLTQFAKHFHPLTLGLENTNETTLAMIAQVRDNSKKSEVTSNIAKYMKDWAATGARAMRHGKLVDITIWPGQKLKKGQGESAAQIGKTLCWEISKGKAGCHDGVRGEVEFHYQKKIDNIETVWMAALENAVIVPVDKKFEVRQPLTKKVLVPALPRAELVKKIAMDFTLEHQIRMEVLATRGIECRYR